MTEVQFRAASIDDLPAIIELLADDEIGQTREVVTDPVDQRYQQAFGAIQADTNQLLAVAISTPGGSVVGCIQLSFIPGLSRTGMWRGQIESVRIAQSQRGGGLGREMFEWALEVFRERRCQLVQLTTDKERPGALKFYQSLGFIATHEGMKLTLDLAS